MSEQDQGEFPAISGPRHYVIAGHYAQQAAETFNLGQYDPATTLAATGQVHATLAAASASGLHEEHGDTREWRKATGQEWTTGS